jgi:hypothetical protein
VEVGHAVVRYLVDSAEVDQVVVRPGRGRGGVCFGLFLQHTKGC